MPVIDDHPIPAVRIELIAVFEIIFSRCIGAGRLTIWKY